jgi:dienelactone hydrolase
MKEQGHQNDIIATIAIERSRDRCNLRSWTTVVAEDGSAAAARPSAIPGYEDWPTYVRTRPGYSAHSRAARDLGSALGVPEVQPALDVVIDWEETHDGVTTSQLSWQLGYGPRTSAWLIRPADADGPLPGVLALHCHGGNKFGGADRLVELPAEHPSAVLARAELYEGRAIATDLARRGFIVLAHDSFAWGSRRFALAAPPWRTADALQARHAQWRAAGVVPSDAELYNAAAAIHEDTIAKAAGLLGTSLAGMVAHDDLAAPEVVAGIPGVDAGRLGCIGFSSGGGRSLLLAALSPGIRGYVVTCMMTTFESLLPGYLDAHSWLLQSPGLWKLGDWPELTAVSTADRFLVQYALGDELFPEEGMRAAHSMLRQLHAAEKYAGEFWTGKHIFTAAMQAQATGFLQEILPAPPEKNPSA